MYTWLARHLMALALDIIRGTQTMKFLSELEESQWWPREKIMELQSQRLRKLLKNAYDTVPYYRRLFDRMTIKPDDIQNINDLQRLPVLTKKLIRDNFDAITAGDFPKKERVSLYTGGSTGETLVFYGTRYDHISLSFAARQRAYSGVGFELGDKYAHLSIKYPADSIVKRFAQSSIDFFRRRLHLDVTMMRSNNLPLYAQRIKRFQPAFIRGYPSAIYLLAQYLQREGWSKINPRLIVTGGEQLYHYQRNLFREVFGCDTFDFYGAREEHLIAFECSQHTGYHIAAENVIVEIVDSQGKPVPDGKEGRILITNLHNFAMPFIRYDIGDYGISSNAVCSCGRGLPLLAEIKGRTTDVILTRTKEAIHYMNTRWDFLLKYQVEQFQIVQETYEKVVVKLVIGEEYWRKYSSELTSEIVSKFKLDFGEYMEIAIEVVKEIPPTPSWKSRIIISKVSAGFNNNQ